VPITISPASFPYLSGNLRLFRLAQRLTQQQLVARLGDGFTQSYVSRLENGLRPVDPQHVDRLAEALGVLPLALVSRPAHPRRQRSPLTAIGAARTIPKTATPGCAVTQDRA
jgi:transcriptional regulator with XRE-family HTH domain